MKCTSLVNLLVVGLLVTSSVVGCKKKPQNLTVLPTKGPEPITDDGAHQPIITPATNQNPPPQPPPRVINTEPVVPTPLPFRTDVADGGGVQPGAPRDTWRQDRDTFKDQTVYFEFDKASVRASEVSKLQAVASKFKGMSAKALLIEGHCDERGTEEYNRSLGERRALAVREKLVALGVDATLIETLSHGEDKPVDPGHSESAWSKNRRGEIILLSPPGAP